MGKCYYFLYRKTKNKADLLNAKKHLEIVDNDGLSVLESVDKGYLHNCWGMVYQGLAEEPSTIKEEVPKNIESSLAEYTQSLAAFKAIMGAEGFDELKVEDKIKIFQAIANQHNNIGNVHLYLKKDCKTAIQFFNKALIIEIIKVKRNKLSVNHCNNMRDAYKACHIDPLQPSQHAENRLKLRARVL